MGQDGEKVRKMNLDPHVITLTNPANMIEVQTQLAKLATFANKIGLDGLRLHKTSFKTIQNENELECTLLCANPLQKTGTE
jgi:hypothetical protein